MGWGIRVVQRSGHRTGLIFRYVVLSVAGFWTLVWLASFYRAICLLNVPRTDGTQWIAPLIATVAFVVLVLPALIIGILGGTANSASPPCCWSSPRYLLR